MALAGNETELGVRLEEVIRLAKLRLSHEPIDWKRDCYQPVLDNFELLKARLEGGNLSGEIGSGSGFGASRALSEWGLEDDEIAQAVGAAEECYRTGN